MYLLIGTAIFMGISSDLGKFCFEPLEAEQSPANAELGHRKVIQNSGSRNVFGFVKDYVLVCSMSFSQCIIHTTDILILLRAFIWVCH